MKAAPAERAYAIISGAAAIPTDCTAKAVELFIVGAAVAVVIADLSELVAAEVFTAAVTMGASELVIAEAAVVAVIAGTAANAVTASFKSAAPVGRLSRAMTIVRIAGNSACKNSAND